jgi:hypothetical protein
MMFQPHHMAWEPDILHGLGAKGGGYCASRRPAAHCLANPLKNLAILLNPHAFA